MTHTRSGPESQNPPTHTAESVFPTTRGKTKEIGMPMILVDTVFYFLIKVAEKCLSCGHPRRSTVSNEATHFFCVTRIVTMPLTSS